jgi:cyclic di-GMP phosphodiesterase Gmr
VPSAGALAAATVDATDALVLVCDAGGRVLLANPALQRFTGLPAAELTGRFLWDVLVIPEEVARARAAVTEAITGTPRLPREVTWLAAGGVRRRVELQSSVLRRGGLPFATSFVGIDVTEQRSREDVLRRRATTDALTGLVNRGALFEVLNRLLADRDGGRCGLLFCDLDGFKAVNDHHGHRAGDSVLRGTADRLRAVAAAGDVVGRLGGDEFGVLLVQTDEEAARRKAATLAAAIEARPLLWQGQEITLSAAYGTHSFAGAENAAAVLDAADRAMYDCKRAARER